MQGHPVTLHDSLPQHQFNTFLDLSKQEIKEFAKRLTPADMEMCTKFQRSPRKFEQEILAKAEQEYAMRYKSAKAAVKHSLMSRAWRNNEMAKAGLTTATGYNFIDLRPPVTFLFPVNVPFRNSMPRYPRVNDGYGTMARWFATRDFGTGWGGVREGFRAPTTTPDFNQYAASYKEIGFERAATFTSQFAGEGLTDNMADEHLRGQFGLWLQEESIIIFGNDGTGGVGNNGFQAGTPATPTVALKAGAGLPNGTNVSVAVVGITALGIPTNPQYGLVAGTMRPSVPNGLTPSYTVNSAVGEQSTVNGGISAVSAMSLVVQTTAGNNQVVAQTNPIRGIVAWAWFVNITDAAGPLKSNASLYAITSAPTVTIVAAPVGAQTAAAAGLNVDHSAEATSFTGLFSYAASNGSGFGATCAPGGSYWNDLNGGSFTTSNTGEINEIEALNLFIFQQYQTQPTKYWMSPDVKRAFDDAVTSAGGSTPFRWVYNRNEMGELVGGLTVSGYKAKYAINETGGNIIPAIAHPMFPPGTFFADIDVNPYPTSRAPFLRGMLTQRDYYAIEWPVVSRSWTWGTYVHELIQHYMPWLSAGMTGIGSFVKGS